MYTTTRLVSAMGARVYGVPGNFKTEAVVLRSIRYGEADRILHLYTEERGRVGAMAKGVRRVKSRFGGRLEPLFRVQLVLHEGRGDLCMVTSAETVAAHPALRGGLVPPGRRDAPLPGGSDDQAACGGAGGRRSGIEAGRSGDNGDPGAPRARAVAPGRLT